MSSLGRLAAIINILFCACNSSDLLDQSEERVDDYHPIRGGVLGQSLGAKAGQLDEGALELVYAESSDIPAASIRLDPDLYPRRLLLQHRQEGATVAREISSVEDYRLLLGGAPSDFSRNPQQDFDATSLLANMSVARRICAALVAPDEWEHEGWDTILPRAPEDTRRNIIFLAQRWFGLPSGEIDAESIDELEGLLEENNTDSRYDYEDYIEVCVALSIDPRSVFL